MATAVLPPIRRTLGYYSGISKYVTLSTKHFAPPTSPLAPFLQVCLPLIYTMHTLAYLDTFCQALGIVHVHYFALLSLSAHRVQGNCTEVAHKATNNGINDTTVMFAVPSLPSEGIARGRSRCAREKQQHHRASLVVQSSRKQFLGRVQHCQRSASRSRS